MKESMSAKQLRTLLLVAMFAIVALAIGGFIFANNQLTNYAHQISTLNARANAGKKNIETLKQLEKLLEEKKELVAKTKTVVGNGAGYTDQVVTQLNLIASRSRVTLSSIEFTDDSTPAAAATPPSTGTAPTAAALAAPVPTGVSVKNVTVSLKSPLSYDSFLSFLVGLETNDLRMQVNSINLTKDEGSNIATQTLTVEVYVRS